MSRLGGSALGGVIAAGGGIIAVTLTDAASFVASAAFLACVRTSGRTASESSGGPVRTRLARIGSELRDGLRLTVRNRVLRALMIFALVTSVGEGIMRTLFTPFVEHVLHGTSQEFGLVVAAQAVGGIAGGVVAASRGRRVQASRLLSYGAIAFGLVDLAVFLYPLSYPQVWPAAVGMIIVGIPGAAGSRRSQDGAARAAPSPGSHPRPGRLAWHGKRQPYATR